jgi:hypothetical protein
MDHQVSFAKQIEDNVGHYWQVFAVGTQPLQFSLFCPSKNYYPKHMQIYRTTPKGNGMVGRAGVGRSAAAVSIFQQWPKIHRRIYGNPQSRG